jgi:hypothetical protein
LSISLSSNAQTVFEFDLPYAIPVSDGSYSIKIGTNISTILIKRMQRTDVAGFKGSGFLQLQFDKYGKSSFSRIQLTLPLIVNLKEKGRVPLLLEKGIVRLKAKETVLHILNRFIEAVRYVTEQYWVEPARYQDILSYQIYYLDGGKKHPAMLTLIDSGVGGIGVGNKHPFEVEKQKIAQLNDVLLEKQELDTSHIFILNSKDACLQEDFRLATIEAVTALEMVLYKFIKMRGEKLGIPKGNLRNFIKETGLTGNINVVLKMLTEGLEQIDEDIINVCKGAITTRNKILHEGFRDVYSTDTEKRIIAIEKMLDYLRKLIANIK